MFLIGLLKILKRWAVLKIILIVILSIIYFFLAFSVDHIVPARIFLFLAIALFIWGYFEYRKENIRREDELIEETEKEIEQFPHTQRIVSDDYLTALLLDEQNNKVCILKKEAYDEKFKEIEVDFHQLYEAAIVEDGKILTLFSKGGFLAGSLLEEGGTSVIHLSGTEEHEKDEDENDEVGDLHEEDGVSKLSIKIVIDDLKKPIVEFSFLESDEPILKDSEEYKDLLKECTEWHQKLSIIIKRYEKERVPVTRWS